MNIRTSNIRTTGSANHRIYAQLPHAPHNLTHNRYGRSGFHTQRTNELSLAKLQYDIHLRSVVNVSSHLINRWHQNVTGVTDL